MRRSRESAARRRQDVTRSKRKERNDVERPKQLSPPDNSPPSKKSRRCNKILKKKLQLPYRNAAAWRIPVTIGALPRCNARSFFMFSFLASRKRRRACRRFLRHLVRQQAGVYAARGWLGGAKRRAVFSWPSRKKGRILFSFLPLENPLAEQPVSTVTPSEKDVLCPWLSQVCHCFP